MTDVNGKHRYKKGEYMSLQGAFSRSGDSFVIMTTLPPDSDDFLYRVKSSSEPYDRIVRESQLTRIVIDSGNTL